MQLQLNTDHNIRGDETLRNGVTATLAGALDKLLRAVDSVAGKESSAQQKVPREVPGDVPGDV
jgi:hypothetical protein